MSPSSGGGSGGDRLEVDPQVLIRAGQRLGSIGKQLGMLSDAATPILNSGIASGLDYAGLNFGLEYSDLARQLAPGLAAVANGAKALGLMLEASGYNYENSDAASTIGGTGPAGGVSGQPSETISASVPSGPNGIGVPPPGKWELVYPFIQFFGGMAMTWPSGHPELMDLLAKQWRNIATGLAAFDDDMAALKTAASTQNIPEGAKIQEKLSTLQTNLANLATSTSGLADRIEEFAVGVQDTQDAIRRILDRLSLDGLIDTVTGFFTGEGDDILRQVGRDIGQLLENFQNQIKGIVGLLGQLKDVIGDAVTALQDLVRPFLVATFGEDVGGALATTFEYYTDFEVGLVNGLINTVAGTVSMLDADTWKGMADMALQVAEDPSKLDDVLLNMGKQFIAYDALTGDNPARGLGEAGFNIGLLFMPGGAASKTGTLAKGISATSRMLEKGELPRLGELPGFRDRTPSLDGLPGAGRGLPDVPEFRPGAVPDSVIAGPHAPNAIDPPSTPRGFDGPAGPPDPPGPTTTPGHSGSGGGGGDGPPPDSPGRPVGPADSGPGRVDGPATQSPTPSGPGSVDSPRISDPSTPSHTPSGGDATPPATQHAPENPSPASTHEPSRSPSDSSPTNHTPSTPESHGNGSPTEHRQPVGNDAPSEHHRPGADEYNGRPEGGTHTPASQQPAHTPAVEQPSVHDRPATDGSPAREQPQTTGVAGTPMAGAPMAPYAPAGAHSPVGSHDPASRTPGPEAPTRAPEARAPSSPESPRAQAPTATGPATGTTPSVPIDPATKNTPSAPVNPAATQSLSGSAGEATRPGPEPSAPRQGESSTPHSAPHESRGHAAIDQPGNQSHPGAGDPNAGNTPGQSPNPSGPVGNPADARVYGPHELDPVEDPAYQTAVEHALRDADGNILVHADPRTNDYGTLVNDGGPTVDGRSNNCLDCSLSALSSFHGDPTVSAPRYPDELPDGTIDDKSGERSGLRRAEDWLGGGMLEFQGRSIADQFDAVHQYVNNLGPGSAALVHNGWHAFDGNTNSFQYHPDGSPVTNGSHATVVVYPEGASGPVWWDPQSGLTSDHPPSWMTDRSTFLHFTPIDPNQGAHHGGSGNQGTGTGVSGTDVADRDVSRGTVPERMGVHEGPEPGADRGGRGTGVGEAGDRLTDGDHLRVPELVGDDGGRGVHAVQTDGRQPGGPSDLPPSVEHHDPPDSGGRADDRLPADGAVADRSPGTDPTVSPDDREAHVRIRSEELAGESGDVPRKVVDPAEPGSVAGSGHQPGLAGDGFHRHVDDPWDINEPAPADHAADDHNAPEDRSRIYSLMDESSHHTAFAPEQLLDNQRVSDALDKHGVSKSDFVELINKPTDSLTPEQRDLINTVRDELPTPTRDTVMQKVIPPGYFDNAGNPVQSRADDYILGNNSRISADQVGGAVTLADDAAHLSTPRQIYDGLRLDYSDSPFAPHDPGTHFIRFQEDPGSSGYYEVPRNSDMGGNGAYDGWDDPFTGNGFTKAGADVIPEYIAKNITMRDGAEMWEVLDDGTQRLVAVLKDNVWIPQGN